MTALELTPGDCAACILLAIGVAALLAAVALLFAASRHQIERSFSMAGDNLQPAGQRLMRMSRAFVAIFGAAIVLANLSLLLDWIQRDLPTSKL